MKSWKRIGSTILASVVALGMLTACGGGGSASSGTKITLFNSKVEIETQLEEMAEKYSEEKGVDLEVIYSGDVVAAHLATKYASNDPYTISMVDAKDVYSLAEEHAVDLSDESWVSDTDYAVSVNGKVYGFPLCVEGRGIIYNADAIENITGEEFDPADYKTLEAFEGLIDELKDGGMESPVGIMKEDWSLAAHFLSEVVEQQPDADAFVEQLQAGTADVANNEKFNQLFDAFDVLKDNNYAKNNAISAEREVTEQKLAEGEIAFMFGGNWDWSVINAYDYTENMGIMPIPEDTEDGTNEKLLGGGAKMLFIDNSDATTDEQREAAKEFLKWLAEDDEGKSFIVETANLVSPFKSNTLEVSDPLGKSIKEYADSGNLIPNYDYNPDDYITVMGAEMQKYLAGEEDRAAFATAYEDYWKTATLSGK
ncbi:ABC transporter substrate-binding protein [Bifidobacterium eulemuris]|uniref:Capsular polysaccharide biosynthesis protein n=1 Tax=Bifidobacterium eulemuris TaxID=1765219 RepID=A0A261GE04_9BIFI|nr:ABC transporter substrate-binding protein [Bifidobacterium eulemuris]OZG69689.1 capsular polysaccharide biosynthesis protein [Bifidobacterium eulemuris]QOL32206.1 carbohydrate ABC transporter substrate-binding protein [Bifidobacterium eulemuris]